MRITKKQLMRLIRESMNVPQNPDNTLEKIFLREVYYRLYYLISFIDKFDFFMQQTSVACYDYDMQLSDKIEKLKSDYDNGYGDRLKLNSQIEIMIEIKREATQPCLRSIERLRRAIEYFDQYLRDLYSYLIIENANKLSLEDASFEFGDSGAKDGKEDLFAIVKNNYNSDNSEKVNIIQYIVDTWNDTDWIIGNIDPEAKAVLDENGISGINTYDKIDGLINLLSDSGTLEKNFQQGMQIMTSTSRFLDMLNKIDGQINTILPNHKDKYESDIEEFLYIFKNEMPNSYKDLIRVSSNLNSNDSDDFYNDLPPF